MLGIFYPQIFWIFCQIQGFLGHFRSFQAILGNFRPFQANFRPNFPPFFFCPDSHLRHRTRYSNVCVEPHTFSLEPSYWKGRVYMLKFCPFVHLSDCTSSLQHFQYRAFKSSQNHVRPHICQILNSIIFIFKFEYPNIQILHQSKHTMQLEKICHF